MRPDDRELAAIAAAAKEATDRPDEIIDPVMVRFIHVDAVQTHPLSAGVIVRDQVNGLISLHSWTLSAPQRFVHEP